MDQRALFKEVTALARTGRASEALRLLGDAVRRGRLDADEVEKAGRRCKSLFDVSAQKIAGRVLLLGQCTTTWIASTLTAAAWGDGRALHVVDGAYDNVVQELLAAPDTAADIVVLLPWSHRLLSDDSRLSFPERVAEESAFWRRAWEVTETRLKARILQVGYDYTGPGAMGYGLSGGAGEVALIRAVNRELRDSLPTGAYFIDLEQVSAELGRGRFYDARRYFWTKQPFSEEGTLRLAQHISAGTRALMTGAKKVLVLDLDNTLWGGVVGETGPLGITLGDGPAGEAFSAFQQYAKRLSDRGIVLAVCSKNNDADAREPFEKNSNMVLSLDDFAQFEASWDSKTVMLRRIAKTLNLGLDSFVFVDDNPAEREQVRQMLPEVAVVDLPDDPAEFIRALDEGLWFETADVTDEDRVRAGQYRLERRRRDAEVGFDSLDSYLTSLEMTGEVRCIDDADMDRVVQLIGKTNQFNLTTRRHSVARVRQMLGLPGAVGLTLRLRDRFGDHGLVAAAIAVPDSDRKTGTLRIDTFLMSCRVINRTAEQFFVNALMSAAREAGGRRLIGEYIPTPKNGLVKDLYSRLGFEPRAETGSDLGQYQLDLAGATPLVTFVREEARWAPAGQGPRDRAGASGEPLMARKGRPPGD